MPQSQNLSRKARASRLVFILVGVFVLSFGLLACGGDDDDDGGSDGGNGGSTSTAAAGTATASSDNGDDGGEDNGDGDSFDTSRADEIAHAALISAEDLPGTGWTVFSEDDFGTSFLAADEAEDVPEACRAFYEHFEDAALQAEEARVGRAARSLSGSSTTFVPPSVDVEIAVYESDDDASDLISKAKGAFESDDFQDCFEELIQGGEEAAAGEEFEFEFEFESVNPSSDVPHNGVRQAFNVKLSLAGLDVSSRAELYAWADGNATAFVSVFGDPETVNADLVKAAVSKTDDKLSAAQ